jgi:hypothetical protein
MKATCQLCGQLIVSKHVPGLDTADVEEFRAYDSLSAQMWWHISNCHKNQTEEGILVQQRAAKMYAMTWADAPDLDELRRRYRAEMLMRMATSTEWEGDRTTHAGALAAAPAAADPEASGDASKSKKSSRNASN